MKNHYVGIDISKSTLDVCLYNKNVCFAETCIQVSNDTSGFKHFLRWLKLKNIDLSTVVVCMEHTGIYSLDLSLFLELNQVDYVLVSGYTVKHSLGLIRGKNDKIDSSRLARYCYLHREELVYTKSKSPLLLRLSDLLSERRRYVKSQSRCKAYLTDHKDKSVTGSIERCKSELLSLSVYIKEVESDILSLIKSDVDLYRNYQLLISIIGVALVNAANILLYTSNFTSFKNARSYACYCGVAPFSCQSGTSIHKPSSTSKMANQMLKSDLSQAALSACCHDPELHLYYQRRLSEGKVKGVVLNAIKFKLIERMFAVVKRGSAYVKLSQYSVSSKKAI
jgi:transposase